MSQFYARYVPPTTSDPVAVEPSIPVRKRSAIDEQQNRRSKKRKTREQNGDDVLAKYSSTKSAGKKDERTTPNAARDDSQIESTEVHVNHGLNISKSSTADLDRPSTQHKALGRNVTDIEQPLHEVALDNELKDANVRHAKVLSRYRSNALPRATQLVEQEESRGSETHNYYDLEPIPQPAVTVIKTVASYATGPEWLGQPIQVEERPSKSAFKDFGLEKVILRNLKAQDKARALPVQSTVIPLMLNKEIRQRPDLCVAAATGSGKTLAYVLPILQDIRNRAITRLRAVVVVPTRALVKQVVQTIGSCSNGLDVRIGTAEGSKPLADEQAQLIDEKQVLDMVEWQRQRDAPVDWSTFSLAETIRATGKKDSLARIGYVTQHSSKIDVLVCTPGRLVEHLQTTKGFNLDDVEWFVADEADRLLNESYHEWLEIVLPALKSQAATRQRDELLRSMYMDVPQRRVTKILVSATMTRDVSELLLLELVNPKLVVMATRDGQNEGTEQDDSMPTDPAGFQLPDELEEFAIAFKDSENKPLYLTNLLEQHISPSAGKFSGPLRKNYSAGVKADNLEDTSSSGLSDSESEDSVSTDSSSSDSETDSSNISSLSSPSSESSSSRNQDIPTKPGLSRHPRVLIFTKSIESAHRLSRLLALLQPNLASSISTFSRTSSSTKASSGHKTRSRVLQSFSSGKTPILICTDLAARGLDVPSLEHVINYDVPSSALTYVHRVGRTARAGRTGKAWTLVEHKQGKWFWETIGGKTSSTRAQNGVEIPSIGRGGRTVQKVNMSIDQEKWMSRYEEALKKLGQDVRDG